MLTARLYIWVLHAIYYIFLRLAYFYRSLWHQININLINNNFQSALPWKFCFAKKCYNIAQCVNFAQNLIPFDNNTIMSLTIIHVLKMLLGSCFASIWSNSFSVQVPANSRPSFYCLAFLLRGCDRRVMGYAMIKVLTKVERLTTLLLCQLGSITELVTSDTVPGKRKWGKRSRWKMKLSSHSSATVSAFIMNIFITELNVFGFSSGPRQRNKIKAYIIKV